MHTSGHECVLPAQKKLWAWLTLIHCVIPLRSVIDKIETCITFLTWGEWTGGKKGRRRKKQRKHFLSSISVSGLILLLLCLMYILTQQVDLSDLQGRRFRHVKIQLVRGAPDNRSNPKATLHVSNNMRCSECEGVSDFQRTAWAGGEPRGWGSWGAEDPGGWGSRGPLMRSAPQSAVSLYRWHSVFYLVFRPFCSLTKSNVPQLVSSLWHLYTPPVYAWLLLTCFGKQHPWKNLWWQKWMISLCLGKKGFLKNRLGNCGMQPEL